MTYCKPALSQLIATISRNALLLLSLLWLVAPVRAELSVARSPQTLAQAISEAETLRVNGHISQSMKKLEQLMDMTETGSKSHTLVSGLLGHLYSQQRRYVQAGLLLRTALQRAEQQQWPLLAGDQANYLGMFYLVQNDLEKAEQAFVKAQQWSERSGDTRLVHQLTLNRARLQIKAGQWQQANSRIQGLPIPALTPQQLLALSSVILTLNPQMPHKAKANSLTAYQALQRAQQMALASGAKRLQANAKGLMADLYWQQQRSEEAQLLYQGAIRLGQLTSEHDLLFRWEWQLAKLYQRQGKLADALDALRRAVTHVEVIRQDIPVDFLSGRSSFRDTLEPLYLQLVSLLLEAAKKATQSGQQQALLVEARNTAELIKRSELEDYFANRCVVDAENEVSLESLSQKTAALYPIMLPERLELLLSFNDRIERVSVPVSKAQIQQSALNYAAKLRALDPDYQALSQQFYQWLIAPVASLLAERDISTLVYLPDGPLRLVPLASVQHQGRWLMQDIAVVTSPGLTLFDVAPKGRDDVNVLLAGLSQPGPVVNRLSDKLYQALNVADAQPLQDRIQQSFAAVDVVATQTQTASASDPSISANTESTHIAPKAIKVVVSQSGPLRIKGKYSAAPRANSGSPLRIVAKYPPTNGTRSGPLRIVARYPAHTADPAGFHGSPLRIKSKRPAANITRSAVTVGNRASQGVNTAAVSSKGSGTEGPLRIKSKVRPKGSIGQNMQLASLKRRLALPGVAQEINTISELFNGKTLLNDGFGKNQFVDEMLQSRYDIVHIASHGVFGDSADNSFLMTYDELLNMDQLESLLVNDKFRQAPVELITLSACQTADGDDRAPLGISGIALRANVRSALGALWAVSDAATVELMTDFYQNLKQPNMSKAEALRQAQLKVSTSAQFQHPFFWSPFILIGNWL